MSVDLEVVQAATGEVVKAFGRLLPQLSSSAGLSERLGFRLRDSRVYRLAEGQ
jgi:hypothetical protein